MNWLKLITQKGRRELVREAARDYLTVENVSKLAADGVSALLANSCRNIPDAKMEAVCSYCREGCTLLACISSAVSDKVITPAEAMEIATQAAALTGGIVTQERVNAVIEKIVEKVP